MASSDRPPPRLGELGEVVAEALLLVESGGRIVDVNPAASRLLSRPAEELVGRPIGELVSSPSQALEIYLGACTASRQMVLGALAVAGGDRTTAYRSEGALFRPRDGAEPAVVLLRLRSRQEATERFRLLNEKIEELGREVVSRMRTEAILDGQRRVLELIASGAPLGRTLEELVHTVEEHAREELLASVLLLDEDGRHLRHGAAPHLPEAYNRAIDGVEIGPEVGSCGTAAFINETVVAVDVFTDPRWRDYRDLAREHDFASCWSTPIASRDGQVLGTFACYYRRPSTPDPGDQGLVSLVVRTAAIAIERKREEEQLVRLFDSEREARAEAEEANRAKDEFIALISHELRNPLNAMLGWTRLLRREGVAEATRERGIETIERNAELQAQLIADILDFARISAGKLDLETEPVDLASVARRAVESMQPAAEAQGVGLGLEEAAAAAVPVQGDPDRLQQVVTNLLANAVKYTPAGGRVGVRVERRGGEAELTVADTGQGISADFLPHVFERFRQADGSRSRRHGGLGLGLAVVRSLVEAHGGRVAAASDGPGSGATFTVRLPVAAVSADQPLPAAVTPAAARIADLRVLVVDDDADARDLLEIALSRCGAEVTTAASAAEALALFAARPPDVVVSDIAMPGTDGLSLVRRIRTGEGAGARVPAVALTAHAAEADRVQALAAGYDLHLSKPVDLGQLVEAIAGLARVDARS